MSTCPIGPTCLGCAKCDPQYHNKRAAKRALQLRTNKENTMKTDYSPIDSYAPAIARLREAAATPASRFAEEYAAKRTKELADSRAASAAIKPTKTPRMTAAQVATYAPPNPYALKESR